MLCLPVLSPTADPSFFINTAWGGGFVLTNSSLPIALDTADSSALYNLIPSPPHNRTHESTTHDTPYCKSWTQDRGLTQSVSLLIRSIRFPLTIWEQPLSIFLPCPKSEDVRSNPLVVHWWPTLIPIIPFKRASKWNIPINEQHHPFTNNAI
jgi:hypothetical protein